MTCPLYDSHPNECILQFTSSCITFWVKRQVEFLLPTDSCIPHLCMYLLQCLPWSYLRGSRRSLTGWRPYFLEKLCLSDAHRPWTNTCKQLYHYKLSKIARGKVGMRRRSSAILWSPFLEYQSAYARKTPSSELLLRLQGLSSLSAACLHPQNHLQCI